MKNMLTDRRGFAAVLLAAGSALVAVPARAQSSGKMLTKKEVSDLAASAKTAEDHRKLAAHYAAVAARHEQEAKDHADLAAKYKSNPTASDVKRPGAPDTASHCLTYAEHCRKAAQSMRELAAMHEEMAKKAK